MTIMPDTSTHVIGGVDTHGETHHAAVIDPLGRHLADREFPASGADWTPVFVPVMVWVPSSVSLSPLLVHPIGKGLAC